MAPVTWKKLLLLALVVAAVSGTSHDPAAPSKGYVYDPPQSSAGHVPLPPLATAAPVARGFLTSYPDGFSYIYAVNHPDAESSSRVEVTRFAGAGGRSLTAAQGAGLPSSLSPPGSLPVVAIQHLAVSPPATFPAVSTWPTPVEQRSPLPISVFQPNVHPDGGPWHSYAIAGPGAPAGAAFLVTPAAAYDPFQATSRPLQPAVPFASYLYPN